MASLKDIRKRIGSVKNTQKVTRAMKLVAAAKLRRAQRAAASGRGYSGALSEVIVRVSRRLGSKAPVLWQRRDPRSLDLVIFTSDRGLCGGFNESLIRAAIDWSAQYRESGIGVTTFVIGRKGREALRRLGVPAVEVEDPIPEGSPADLAATVAGTLKARHIAGMSDGSILAYNRFISAGRQQIVFDDLLPFHHRGGRGERYLEHLYEPGREEMLGGLVNEGVVRFVMQALLDSRASELASRMRAMDNATKNADDMIDHLTLLYNRARQASITSDLMDIVGGAEALK